MHPPPSLRCIGSAAIYFQLPLLLGAACVGRTQPGNDAQGRGDGAPVSEYVVDLFEDRAGNVWLGTIGDGVARYGVSPGSVAGEKSLAYWSVADGLVGDTVVSICEDRDGNLWFGTHSGLSKYDGRTFTNFTTKDGLCNNRVSKVCFDKAGTL
jgi:ligand-binding sensor domain-containing protein